MLKCYKKLPTFSFSGDILGKSDLFINNETIYGIISGYYFIIF